MRAGIKPGAVPRLRYYPRQIVRQRPLPLGTGYVNGTNTILRVAQALQQLTEATKIVIGCVHRGQKPFIIGAAINELQRLVIVHKDIMPYR